MAFPLSAPLRDSPPLYPPNSTPSFSLFKKSKPKKEEGGTFKKHMHTENLQKQKIQKKFTKKIQKKSDTII